MPVTIRDLLAMKNSAVVYTCAPDDTVAEACRALRDRRVGCLVVDRGGGDYGLFSEREVIARVVAEARDPNAVRVAEVMRPATPVSLELSADALEEVLRRARQRHAPVVGQRGLLGVVSLGDLARLAAARARAAEAALRPAANG